MTLCGSMCLAWNYKDDKDRIVPAFLSLCGGRIMDNPPRSMLIKSLQLNGESRFKRFLFQFLSNFLLTDHRFSPNDNKTKQLFSSKF